jgi:hypothetical protein
MINFAVTLAAGRLKAAEATNQAKVLSVKKTEF